MLTILLVLLAADPQPGPFTSPKSPSAEYGQGLSKEEALAGWIAVFDGQSTFGWDDAIVESHAIAGGRTSSSFGNCELKGDVSSPGKISVGDFSFDAAVGKFQRSIKLQRPAPIELAPGVTLKALQVKPSELQTVFNGRDLTGWTVLSHPQLPKERQTRWSVAEGSLRGVGGPGALELDGRFGNLVLQVEVRMRAKLVNSGVFFRSVPGDFMNGYEAQLFNGCYDEDPGKPARYSTGAIDDRQLARRLVSRDFEPLVMTVVASGPHIATWVNGYQTIDWKDTRAMHANPRVGLRLEAGTIQLQAHDVGTDIEFRRIAVAKLD